MKLKIEIRKDSEHGWLMSFPGGETLWFPTFESAMAGSEAFARIFQRKATEALDAALACGLIA